MEKQVQALTSYLWSQHLPVEPEELQQRAAELEKKFLVIKQRWRPCSLQCVSARRCIQTLTAEGQATLERLEGMLSQSTSSQYNMTGVRTEDSLRDYENGMEVDAAPAVAGQFEDADVDH